MSDGRRHVIRRESIDLTVEGSESDGFALQNQAAALCRDWLTPALDEVFARMVPAGEHWLFERIDIDAGHFTPETFPRDFVAAVKAALEQELETRGDRASLAPDTVEADGARLSGAQSIQEAFLCFLATGALPWWCRLPEGRSLEQMVGESWSGEVLPPLLRTALPRLMASPDARLRLVRQCPVWLLERLVEGLAPSALPVLRRVSAMTGPGMSGEHDRDVPAGDVWQAAFACVALGMPVAEESLRQALRAMENRHSEDDAGAAIGERASASRSTGEPPSGVRLEPAMSAEPTDVPPVQTQASDTQRKTASPFDAVLAPRIGDAKLDLHEGVFVDAAGIVLLHPFLPLLFERQEVVVDGRLVRPDRAFALLHFLATGQTRAPEHALVLPKLLCGWDPAAPAPAPIELSEAAQAEAQSLLVAAIGHWGALGDTSPDALRGTFLARPGKLSRRDEDDVLQVETQAYDVLLGQLPWGIGTVRLPWMPRFLWVEWPF